VLTAPVVIFVVGLPRVQLAALNVPPPGGTLLLLQLTVPVGALAEVGVLSVTVAVQLVELPTGTDAGEQLTAVLVACWRAVTTVVPLEPLWVASPA
jgi:hypothetical protein